MNKIDYVSLETAKMLKEAGYDKVCIFRYNISLEDNTELTHSKRNGDRSNKIYIDISNAFTMSLTTNVGFYPDVTAPYEEDHSMMNMWISPDFYSTYEQALDEAIREACKMIIKCKNK